MGDAIDTGDVVLHQPTGEEWLVAYVEGDRLAWCGWPSGVAARVDCKLVRKATADERVALLRELAAMSHHDHRRTVARATLVREGISPTPTTAPAATTEAA